MSINIFPMKANVGVMLNSKKEDGSVPSLNHANSCFRECNFNYSHDPNHCLIDILNYDRVKYFVKYQSSFAHSVRDLGSAVAMYYKTSKTPENDPDFDDKFILSRSLNQFAASRDLDGDIEGYLWWINWMVYVKKSPKPKFSEFLELLYDPNYQGSMTLPYQYNKRYSRFALYMNFARSVGGKIIFEPDNLPASSSVIISAQNHLISRVNEFALAFYLNLTRYNLVLQFVQPMYFRSLHFSSINRLSTIAVNLFMNYIKLGIAHEK